MAIGCAVLTAGAWVWAPDRPRVALGVVGGGLLAGVLIWAVSGLVLGVAEADESGEIRRFSRAFHLVKFFTRHVILALAAYGMMLRLQLDPVGMIVGVSSLWVAGIIELVRLRRR